MRWRISRLLIVAVAAASVAAALYARRRLLEEARLATRGVSGGPAIPGPAPGVSQPPPIPAAASEGDRWLRRPPAEEGDEDDDPQFVHLDDVNPKEFVRPFDRPFDTPEERRRLMEEPGVKFVRRGPKGSPFYEMGEYVWPFDDDQFRVRIQLEPGETPRERELAEEARRRIKFARPGNPGRAASFPSWSSSRAGGREAVPLVHSGWRLEIRRVRPTEGGWQARVHVTPVLRTEHYGQVAAIRDFHVEIYRWKDHALRLEQDYPDPARTSDPDDGVECVIFE